MRVCRGDLLAIGLPLTIALGAGAALILLPGEGLAFACLLGAVLAPTDAALGLPIFNNPRVPVRIRRALNIESGLNDGIATPFVLLFLAFAVATEEEAQAAGGWLRLALSEIALAVLAGAAIGLIGGWLLRQAARRGWTTAGSEADRHSGIGAGRLLRFGGRGRQRLHRRLCRRHCLSRRHPRPAHGADRVHRNRRYVSFAHRLEHLWGRSGDVALFPCL